jgi:hypothetical protein
MRHRHLDLPLITRDERRAQREVVLRRRLASVPPLPSTLRSEGADQPFCREIVAAQASMADRAGCAFMVATG